MMCGREQGCHPRARGGQNVPPPVNWFPPFFVLFSDPFLVLTPASSPSLLKPSDAFRPPLTCPYSNFSSTKEGTKEVIPAQILRGKATNSQSERPHRIAKGTKLGKSKELTSDQA